MKRWTWHDVIGTSSAQLQSRVSFSRLPIPARVPTPVKATVGITPSQRKVYGMVWERRPWDRGPCLSDSHSPVNPSCLRVPGLTLETQFGLPVCPAGGSQAYIRSHHPTPTSPGPEAPASWMVMAAGMSM